MTSAIANTVYVRRALSGLKLVATPLFFFFLPVYGISHGIDTGTENNPVKMLKILDDWFNLVGTQTAPPDVKPVLYVALGLGVISDFSFLALNRKEFRVWLQVARVFNLLAGIIAAVCGELILEHVASNTLPPERGAKITQTAKYGSMISVLMILMLVPVGYEFLVVIGIKTPKGD